jgi:hypothetical protein
VQPWKRNLIIIIVVFLFVSAPATMTNLLNEIVHSLAVAWDSLKAANGWH